MNGSVGSMVYCTKCGTDNEDDAAYCKKCGKPMAGAPVEGAPAAQPQMYPPGHDPDRRRGGPSRGPQRDFDKQCEEDCSGSGQKYSWFWGAIIILIGLFIIFEAGIKNIEGLPDWVYDIQLWWVIPVLIGIIIIMMGMEAIGRSGRQRE